MCHTSNNISIRFNLGAVVGRRWGLVGLLLWVTMAGGAFAAAGGPMLSVRDISMPAGRTFTQPLDGADPQGAPLSFSIVSISDGHLGASLTNGNRSLRLAMSGKDGTGSNVTGDVVLELFEDLTPLTTGRIIQLVNSGYYDGLTFHRVIQNFMAQGGDPLGNGLGGSGQTLDDELVSALSFTGFGQLSMANAGHDSSDSQFFITDPNLVLGDVTRPPPRWLDYGYTIFGQMTHGFDVLTKLMATPVNSNALPIAPWVINRATVFTNTQAAVVRLQAAPGFAGTVAVVVQATSASGLSTQQTFHVSVVANTVNDPPILGPVPANLNTTANIPVGFVLTAADVDGDLAATNLASNLALIDPNTGLFPATLQGASYDPGTSVLGLFPASNFTGRVDIFLAVSDPPHAFGAGGYDFQRFSLTVLGSSCSAALSATNIAVSGDGTVGTVAVTTGPACPWVASSSQHWITIQSGTSGTGSGTVSYQVAANSTPAPRTGRLLISGQSVTITQAGKTAAPVIITDEVLPPGGAFLPYHSTLTAFGGTPPDSWAVVAGSLPAGLTLVPSTGAITGTPTVAGLATFTVQVTDSNGLSTNGAEFSLLINVVPLPVIRLTGNLTFDAIPIGTTAQQTLTIANTGHTDLNVSGISYPAGFSGPFSGSVPTGSATNVTVTFTPTLVTNYIGLITVSSDATAGTNTINVAGIGLSPAPTIAVAPAVTNAMFLVHNQPVVVAGETNVFAVGATGSNLFYQWVFGDGATNPWSPASTVAHSYSTNTCGSVVASVSVSNEFAVVRSNFNVAVACSLPLSKLQATVNFGKTNSDTCTLAATLDLGANYNLTNKVVTLDIGGARVAFPLDLKGKGRGTGPYGSCSLTYNKASHLYLLTASLAKGFWQPYWLAHGMTNQTVLAKSLAIVIMPVTVTIDTEVFVGEKRLLYTATWKKTGTAKF